MGQAKSPAASEEEDVGYTVDGDLGFVFFLFLPLLAGAIGVDDSSRAPDSKYVSTVSIESINPDIVIGMLCRYGLCAQVKLCRQRYRIPPIIIKLITPEVDRFITRLS